MSLKRYEIKGFDFGVRVYGDGYLVAVFYDAPGADPDEIAQRFVMQEVNSEEESA